MAALTTEQEHVIGLWRRSTRDGIIAWCSRRLVYKRAYAHPSQKHKYGLNRVRWPIGHSACCRFAIPAAMLTPVYSLIVLTRSIVYVRMYAGHSGKDSMISGLEICRSHGGIMDYNNDNGATMRRRTVRDMLLSI